MIVNGVTLPDIPADVLAEYPYAVIMTATLSDTVAYVLVAANAEIGKCAGSVIGSTWEEMLASFGAGVAYGLSDDETEWEFNTSKDIGSFTFQIGDTGIAIHEVVWSSHDIYEITSINPSTGAYTKGDIWFSKTADSAEPSPTRYSIAKAILDAVARQIMRLTDSTAKVKPEEFEAKLESVSKGGSLAPNERVYQFGTAIGLESLSGYFDFASSASGSLSD